MIHVLSKRITIFEGVDGSGKTTAAKAYALQTNARYEHFGPFTHVSKGLARMYAEAMLPALLGYQDVVMDRSWISEWPYGMVMRNGLDRIDVAGQRMLERLAMRCGAIVVHCDPGWKTVAENYTKRKSREVLDNLLTIYTLFRTVVEDRCQLPHVIYDYTKHSARRGLDLVQIEELDKRRMLCHTLSIRSAGNLQASIVLVGDEFAEHKDSDLHYQWPFASFSSQGCSQWLTEQLAMSDIPEHQLLWVNSDQDLEFINNSVDGKPLVVAFGNKAARRLHNANIKAIEIAHPQYWKRFHFNKPYQLIKIIQESI